MRSALLTVRIYHQRESIDKNEVVVSVLLFLLHAKVPNGLVHHHGMAKLKNYYVKIGSNYQWIVCGSSGHRHPWTVVMRIGGSLAYYL